MNREESIAEEKAWRDELLAEIGGKVVNYGISPIVLRDCGIYGGQQGIWVDKTRTEPITEDGYGLAVSLLHKGDVYPDDFDETGVIYHYPVTNRPESRDLGEIEAVKNCRRHNVPIFVITESGNDKTKRDVFVGYVTTWDDRANIFIIRFGSSYVLVSGSEERPFELQVKESVEMYGTVRRPKQAAFRIEVFERYGPQCAVCDMTVVELLDAAHLVPKSEHGTDDPRNGLPFCALHHRAFDRGLFSIDPDTCAVVTMRNGSSTSELLITKDDISHLWAKPHQEALQYCWAKFRK